MFCSIGTSPVLMPFSPMVKRGSKSGDAEIGFFIFGVPKTFL